MTEIFEKYICLLMRKLSQCSVGIAAGHDLQPLWCSHGFSCAERQLLQDVGS